MAVPKLRFPGFKDDWKNSRLGDMSDIKTGPFGTQLSAKEYVGQGTPVINVKNIGAGRIITDDLDKVSDETVARLKDHIIFKNDIVFGRKGALGRHTIIGKNEEGWLQGSDCIRVRLKSKEDASFANYCLQTSTVIDYLKIRAYGSTMLTLTTDMIADIPIWQPTTDEKKKIANLLMQIDNVISACEAELEKTKTYKQGLLQKMFPKEGQDVPEIRFPGFEGKWEPHQFGEIAMRLSDVLVSDANNPSVEYEDVVTEQGTLNKNIYQKPTSKKGIAFSDNEILYGKLRPYLHNWLRPDFNGVAVGDWWVIKPIDINRDFLYRLIQTKRFDEAANQSSGTKMPRADWNIISSLVVLIPPTSCEQKKVGEVFDNLDALISLHQKELDKWKELKKGLLQQMFV